MTKAQWISRYAGAVALAILFGWAAAIPGAAQNAYPSHPITLIVPFPPGGPSDGLARVIAQVMSRDLNENIVIENISGASGTIGLTKLVRSSPDGYTLGFGTVGTHVANVALFKKLSYDPITDFEPIGLAGTAPTLLLAKTALPVSNLKEFVEYAKANGTTMTFGSAGLGSISHIACVSLLSSLKLNITHVPYRGVAPALNDLMGGQIDFMCDQTTTSLPQLAGGRIKAIAVLTDRKLQQLTNVETAASAGYPDINLRAWNAFFVPKGTPASVVDRLNKALRASVTDPALRRQMEAVAVDLPSASELKPSAVTDLIAIGLKNDVPALRANGGSLD